MSVNNNVCNKPAVINMELEGLKLKSIVINEVKKKKKKRKMENEVL